MCNVMLLKLLSEPKIHRRKWTQKKIKEKISNFNYSPVCSLLCVSACAQWTNELREFKKKEKKTTCSMHTQCQTTQFGCLYAVYHIFHVRGFYSTGLAQLTQSSHLCFSRSLPLFIFVWLTELLLWFFTFNSFSLLLFCWIFFSFSFLLAPRCFPF